MGLARIVPEGGLEVSGRHFKAGSILSVPSYTIHRDPGVWGEDVNAFRPDRWLPDPRLSENENKEKEAKMLNTFNPFSYGPRACVGKNLANMELLLIIASVMRRYEFVLQHPDRSLDTREGFLRKPLECFVGIKRRND
jgi:benzoate 4-monooxygenase